VLELFAKTNDEQTVAIHSKPPVRKRMTNFMAFVKPMTPQYLAMPSVICNDWR